MEKFLEKNEKQLEELFNYIDENRDNIQSILISPEMFEILGSLSLPNIMGGKTDLVINKKMVVVSRWVNPERIRFVMKEPHFDFNIPCVCGIYKDEIHP